MRVRCAVLSLIASAFLFGQQPTAPANSSAGAPSPTASCGNGPIDDYLAAKNKALRVRNKNPLPNGVCIGSWCRSVPNGAPSDKSPPQEAPKETTSPTRPSSDESSSKPKQLPTCDVYAAVQDVEVGDFYYESKKYRAALSRYESALRSKASDPGILLRLGKTAEKLGDAERAAREFQASIDAAPDGPTAKDAKSGLARTSKNAN